ncbi:2-C-methyl-D-erythritol 4-phosphate cytidylyltransferase [Rohdeia mirabilis]
MSDHSTDPADPEHSNELRRPGSAAVLVAAGSSRRMGSIPGRTPSNKTLLEAAGAPLLVHAARALASVVDAVVVVGRADQLGALESTLAEFRVGRVAAVVAGGAERADSVRAGLAAVPASATTVLVHDAARPLVLPLDVARVVDAAREHGAALLVEAMVDTVKHSTDGRFAGRTLDRSELWRAQTPQGFDRERLVALHAAAERAGRRTTDDASLWEEDGGKVALVESGGPNPKVTRPDDLVWVRAVLRARRGRHSDEEE